ncbi:unnamed protein product [Parnassius mnemosyne]|uniref:Integrase catalytic domain-containing protein n=1 Tax=Parnassius mnemosyne TaxID=213953 RepID=A0AAV1KNU6_9NEOP
MYRQIMVNEQDQRYQKIIWRELPEQPLQSYQLCTVTYGTKSAPFLAMMTLKQLAEDEQATYPEASLVLKEAFYMDDLVHGAHSIQQGRKLFKDLNRLLQLGGFTLRKWASNSNELFHTLEKSQIKEENIIFNFKTEHATKTLGLCWLSNRDTFTFCCNMSIQEIKPTKRCLLSEISKLYDPLGWLAPISTKLKILFQNVWKLNISWDEKIPENIQQEWRKIRSDMNDIQEFEIPRWIGCKENEVFELHGFSDASEHAFACVVYARTKNQPEAVLLAAKTRLVPNKKEISLPRLELNAAHLLCKLINKIKQCMCQHKIEIYGWTDSMVVLGWLNRDPSRWKAFVANRVNYITTIIAASHWSYVKSKENSADAASRGLYVSQLKNNQLWWHGPTWLQTFSYRPNEKQVYQTKEEIRSKQTNFIQKDIHNSIIYTLLNKFSSFTKITRIVAWILRFLTPKQKGKQWPSYLTIRELKHAKLVIIKHVQENDFQVDIEYLYKYNTVHTSSKLRSLNPVLSEGILKVGGRLKNANIHYDMMHPILIPHKSRLTDLLIDHAHNMTFHGGPRLTLGWLRHKYWIVGGNRAVKLRLRNCVKCRKNSPSTQHQLMADLPESRVNPAPPFQHTGVDYTGFVEIKSSKGRGIKTTKGYIAVFVCMVTKAIHLELVSDLSTSAFLAALRRMAARRGAPRHIYSDNGSNFVGANRILQEEYQQLQHIFNNNLLMELSELNIEWHFNAPSWPSAGGLWERAVRSLKHHLKRVVGDQKLTYEEYSTVLSQIEACLNSRPLCPLTENVEDLEFLTPAHFLTTNVGSTIIETPEDARTRWQLTKQIFQGVWKRWKAEYLTQLSSRSKWLRPRPNMKIGDMVIIQDDNLPPGKWAMGRVVELHPGSDGHVRVVTLKTKNGNLKRPVSKLSLLPIETSSQQNEQKDRSNNFTQKITHKQENKLQGTRSKFSSIVMSLMFFICLFTPAFSTSSYNITTFNNNQSIYFDPIGKMQIIQDKWTLIVYYNLEPYWEGIKAF